MTEILIPFETLRIIYDEEIKWLWNWIE